MIKCSGVGWSSLLDGAPNKKKPGPKAELRSRAEKSKKKPTRSKTTSPINAESDSLSYLGLAVVRRLPLASAGNHIEGPGAEWRGSCWIEA